MKICLNVLLTFLTVFASAQNSNCIGIEDIFKIENQSDIPTITDNGDGTITLTHPNQDITDLFAPYTIYNLEQSVPSSSNPDLLKYYDILHNSKDLMVDMQSAVFEDVYTVGTDYTTAFPFLDNFLDFIDGKQYEYSGYAQISSEGGNSCTNINTCPLNTFSDDFSFNVLFTFDEEDETLFIETEEATSCGNEFKIALKPGINTGSGGNTENQILTWNLVSVVLSDADSSEECYGPEMGFLDAFGITCTDKEYYGNIYFNFVPGIEKIRFFRENILFFTAALEFKDPELTINDNTLSTIFIYQSPGNEYLSISAPNQQHISATIYDISGKKVLDAAPFENEQLDISALQKSAVYFITLTTSNDMSKTVKFIKR